MQENLDAAEKHLKETRSTTHDLRIYQMTNPDQVFEKSRSLLRIARKAVVADLYPLPLRRLSPSLARAGARKIDVTVKCYRGESIKGVRMIAESRPGDITGSYPGQWLKIVADARGHVIAFLSDDLTEVYQAVWSRSPFLSVLHFNATKSEMLLDQINGALKGARGLENIERIIKAYNAGAKRQLPGYGDLKDIPAKNSGGRK